jgi:hypothetical protein
MKLVNESKGVWRYQLKEKEAAVLVELIKKFPFAEIDHVKISNTEKDPDTIEREKLLNESLSDHRRELKSLAQNLLDQDKFKKIKSGQLLTLDSEEREILLQVLNDIRIGSWHVLGDPESLESTPANPSNQYLAYRGLMDVAGYFEIGLIAPEGAK